MCRRECPEKEEDDDDDDAIDCSRLHGTTCGGEQLEMAWMPSEEPRGLHADATAVLGLL